MSRFDASRFLNRFQYKLHSRMLPLYAMLDATIASSFGNKVLFIDCGANLGQGYAWFSKFFHQPKVDFEMFEPNPNCILRLQEQAFIKSGKVILHIAAVGTQSGVVKFYGLDNSESGETALGGSIIQGHNSKYYAAREDKSIEVQLIDFSKFIEQKVQIYDRIVVKMDIEGAEVNLLEKMIQDGSINLIDILYVEFHSQYQRARESAITRQRELQIVSKIRNHSKVRLRIWR